MHLLKGDEIDVYYLASIVLLLCTIIGIYIKFLF